MLPLRLTTIVVLFLAISCLPAFAGQSCALSEGELVAADESAGEAATSVANGSPASVPAGMPVALATRALQNSDLRRSLQATSRLANPLVVGPALLASYFTGRITGLPELSASSARVFGATVGAVAVAGALDLGVGRLRPGSRAVRAEAGTSGWGVASFPSLNSAVAFAAASAIDAETSAGWVPWVAYSAASTVCLLSAGEGNIPVGDVLTGAVVGYWTGRKVDEIERGKVRALDHARFLLRGSRRNFRVGFQTKF